MTDINTKIVRKQNFYIQFKNMRSGMKSNLCLLLTTNWIKLIPFHHLTRLVLSDIKYTMIVVYL